MKLIVNLVFLYVTFFINAQESKRLILWNEIDKIPIAFANINQNGTESISNENGVINILLNGGNIQVSNVAYETKLINQDEFKIRDTIFVIPKFFNLEEIVLKNDDLYTKMFNTVLTNYALEPHTERFFLRAIIRKNNQIYKVVDIAGLVEKQTLFGTSIKEMSKKNYSVNVENIRKVGFEFKEYDFAFFSFKEFFNIAVSGYLSPKFYKFKYRNVENSEIFKIDALPKDNSLTKRIGHYIVNSTDNTFSETYTIENNENTVFSKIRDYKYHTTFFEVKSGFKRNLQTTKYQLNQVVMKYKTIVYQNDVKDVFDVQYVYTAFPENTIQKIEKNINENKDIFDLKSKYDSNYWAKNEILPLTNEIQTFINKVNEKVDKPNFKTINNIK